MKDVIVYTSDRCGYCNRAKGILKSRSIDFDEINISQRPEKQQWLLETTGRSSLPQIFIHDQPIGGYLELKELDDQGQLLSLVKKETP